MDLVTLAWITIALTIVLACCGVSRDGVKGALIVLFIVAAVLGVF